MYWTHRDLAYARLGAGTSCPHWTNRDRPRPVRVAAPMPPGLPGRALAGFTARVNGILGVAQEIPSDHPLQTDRRARCRSQCIGPGSGRRHWVRQSGGDCGRLVNDTRRTIVFSTRVAVLWGSSECVGLARIGGGGLGRGGWGGYGAGKRALAARWRRKASASTRQTIASTMGTARGRTQGSWRPRARKRVGRCGARVTVSCS